jgi:DNA-binding beta-propeller fold protein YncE
MAATLLAVPLAGCEEPDDVSRGIVRIFGRTGLGPGEFSYPRAAVFARDGGLFVVDKSARIQGFDPDGGHRLDWHTPVWDAGKPTGLGIGPDGRIFVADTHYSRVLVYEPDGTAVAQFGTRGTGPGQFLLPTDVAVGPDGCIYVGEYSGNDRISKFTPAHEYLFSFADATAGPGHVQRPQCLLFGPDGVLWVADACNHRIARYSTDGRFLGAFGRNGTADGELRFPYGMDWLPDGTLLVTEYGNNLLQRFERDGRSLGTWGRAGRGAGELAYPWAVVTRGARAYVIDSGNNRVQVLDTGAARFRQRR